MYMSAQLCFVCLSVCLCTSLHTCPSVLYACLCGCFSVCLCAYGGCQKKRGTNGHLWYLLANPAILAMHPPLSSSPGPLSLGFLCTPFLFSPSPPTPSLPSFHGLVQSAGRVQSALLSLCFGFFQMPLAVLSIIPTIKTFPSNIPRSGHVLSL